MEFGLSDEQLALQTTARRFAREQVAPVAAEFDRTGEFPREVIRKAWELGLSSTVIPAELGGVTKRTVGRNFLKPGPSRMLRIRVAARANSPLR